MQRVSNFVNPARATSGTAAQTASGMARSPSEAAAYIAALEAENARLKEQLAAGKDEAKVGAQAVAAARQM